MVFSAAAEYKILFKNMVPFKRFQ